MDARYVYYDALQRKQERDSRNPIMEQAVAGWTSGIQSGLKNRQENINLANRMNAEDVLKSKQDRADLARKILENSDVYLDGELNNTPGVINLAYQEMVTLQPSGKNIEIKPRRDALKEAQAGYYNAYTRWTERDRPRAGEEGEWKNSSLFSEDNEGGQTMPSQTEEKTPFNISNVSRAVGQSINRTAGGIFPLTSVRQVALSPFAKNLDVRKGQEQQLPISAPVQQLPITQEDREAFNWALSNPEDPRSSLILQKLKTKGMK